MHLYTPHALLGLSVFAHLAPTAFASFFNFFELEDTYIGEDFYQGFDFNTFDDPTHGRVNYVSQEAAVEKNLSYVSDSKFVMRADYQNVVPLTARGRDSVRMQSRKAYKDSIIVLDLNHMPEGCATWPAFWTVGVKGPWPKGGEIDGVNNDVRNLMSQHTSPGCTVPKERPMTGQTISTNCDANVNFNQGCGVRSQNPDSYGALLNKAHGGWYVMQRTTEDGVSIWFWSRHHSRVPRAVRNGELFLQPDESWGLPDAYFPTTSCRANHFEAHNIIFDLTFCGDWAGTVYNTSGCPGTCVDRVNNNPSAFVEAYWEINSLLVYTPFF